MPSKRRNQLAGSTAEVVKRIQQQIEAHRKTIKKGQRFVALTDEQIKAKLKRVNSPMIVGEGWTSEAARGAEISYSVNISNPDAVTQSDLFVHLFVGTGNVATNPDLHLLNVDPRFSRLMKPANGLTLAPGASQTIDFRLKMPSIARSSYEGSAVLVQLDFLGSGIFLDRAAFVFRIT